MIEFLNKSEKEKTCFNLNVAELEAEIKTVYPSSYYFCQDYLSEGSPVIRIEVTQEDIQNEIDRNKQFFYNFMRMDGDQEKYKITKEINESRVEVSIVHRKLIEAVLDYDVVFMHGAVIAYQNQSFMFTAPSGTGKTTHILKWMEKLEGVFVVNGDKPFIKIKDSDVIAYGTPWCGKEKYGTNTKIPLKAVVLMERCEENHIQEISFGQALPFLMQQTYFPQEANKARKVLNLLAKLYKQVHVYKFQFNNFTDDCFEVAYQGILGKKG